MQSIKNASSIYYFNQELQLSIAYKVFYNMNIQLLRLDTPSYLLTCNQYSSGPLGLKKFHFHDCPLHLLGKMARNGLESWFL